MESTTFLNCKFVSNFEAIAKQTEVTDPLLKREQFAVSLRKEKRT
jgi:hypothetical protein